MNIYSLIAELVLIVHFCIVVFVVGGQLTVLLGWTLRWNWARNSFFRWLHLGTMAWVFVQSLLGRWCPLTVWEHNLRLRAGQDGYRTSFIDHWFSGLIFFDAPAWVFIAGYSLFFLLVVACFLGYPPRRPARLAKRYEARRRP